MADPVQILGKTAEVGSLQAANPAVAAQLAAGANMVDPAAPLVEVGMMDMLSSSSALGLAVLFILVVLSVISWAIVIAKILQFRRVKADSQGFSSVFWESRNFARIDDSARRFVGSPLVSVFSAGYREFSKILQDNSGGRAGNEEIRSLNLALKRAEAEESQKLEQGLTFLATTASAAPFIGLFGTVWGIMHAFHGLGQAKSSSIQAVAPGISEALVATAVGLGAAIPAAVAFNYFSVSVRRFREGMNRFSTEFINMAQHYLSGR
jgi:biopolymer transport protein TolQ